MCELALGGVFSEALAHFVEHTLQLRSVDRLQKHQVKCGLFTDLFGQTDNLHLPIFVVCVCCHSELLKFLEDNKVVEAECPAFHPLFPITHRSPKIERW